ncbi:hypothetical protein AGMMS49944_27590 [Spirochaetia bacterium]|nr:hypothetical protein AGMMS49944_27590 [Spirochaetia bacterium]
MVKNQMKWITVLLILSAMLYAGCLHPDGTVGFIPVTGIGDVPDTATVGTNLYLTGTVVPADASNKVITWSVASAGTTGAVITGGTLTTTGTGTLVVTAVIVNGLASSSNYTQNFTITVQQSLAAAITSANAARSGVVVSVNGSDVATDTQWVTQAVLDTFNAAITAAETVSTNVGATQAQVDGAVTALNTAINTFTAAKANGTYTAPANKTALTAAKTAGTKPGIPAFTMLLVSPPGAGGFKYGSGPADIAYISKGYWIGETEVTQELFQAVMGVNPSYFASGSTSGEVRARRPVEQVNWYAAIAFCNKLSILEGKNPVYSVKIAGVEVDWANLAYGAIPVPATGNGNSNWDNAVKKVNMNGYRLPYEMEWMWAAMGGNSGGAMVANNGYTKAFAGSTGANSIVDYAWYGNVTNAGGKTHEVGKNCPMSWGSTT